MASTISRNQTLNNRAITVEIKLVAKDAADDALIGKFGDIMINTTGSYNDPQDGTYPPFYVNAGDPVPFFTQQIIRYIFVNDTLDILALQKQADLWADAICLQIQNKLVALRALVDNTTISSTITI